MPVPHDLFQDLSCTKEEIQKKRSTDAKLDSLINKYLDSDHEVVAAETATSDAPDDDTLKKLKTKRLGIKDDIVQHLKPGTQ